MTKRFQPTLVLITALLGSLPLSGCFPSTTATTPAPASDACRAEPQVLTTSARVKFVRTPDACFANLPDWNYAPKYLEIDGLRQAYIDEGPRDADPVLLLHGQPSWSYLYRYIIPVLVKEGHRVIAMDHVGMGRSDKPVDTKYHSFKNHVDRLETFVKELKLTKLTVFTQDWGALTSLYLAGTKPELFDRFGLGNAPLVTITKPAALPSDIEASNAQLDQIFNQIPPQQPYFFDESGKSTLPMPPGGGNIEDAAGQWIAYAMYSKSFRASKILEGGTFRALSPGELAAYDAPFPSEITMAGPRSFPSLTNQLVGIYEQAMKGLTSYEKPFLTIFGANELGTPIEAEMQKWAIANIPGAAGQHHHRYRDAGHFLRDDKGADIAERINSFMAGKRF